MSQDSAVKLERLLINEVSGVDRGANMLDGWIVQKASAPSYPVGPDQAWDVGAADKRIRKATGADDAPNAKYAGCFLYKSGDGTKYGDYKFLVCDVVDGDINVMPAAIRAAASRVSGSSLSDADKSAVQSKIDALEKRAKIGDYAKSESEEATSLLRKIKELVFPTNDEGDHDVTPEELTKAVGEAVAPLTEKVEALESAQKAAAESAEVDEVAKGAETEEAKTEGPDTDAIAKAITDGIGEALKPYNEILEKVLDRIEGVEKAYGVRKSLDGQEAASAAEGDEAATTTKAFATAIEKALRNPSSGVAGA